MGDRVAIQFVKDSSIKVHGDSFGDHDFDQESAILCDHWGGMNFVHMARQFVIHRVMELAKQGSNFMGTPATRLEPEHLLAQFICYLYDEEAIPYGDYEKTPMSSRYLVKDEADCDCSDNGLHKIEVNSIIEQFRKYAEADIKSNLELQEHNIN